MSQGTGRRILSDLNVNTFGTPSTTRFIAKGTTSLKRGINDVEEPESSPAPLRVCSEPHLTSKELETQESTKTNKQETSPSDSATTMLSDAVELEEEMNNSDSQQSNNDSTASLIDSDVEGDTIASQQTTATEITMPIQSAASLHVENLRLRLRVALFKVQTNQTSIPMSRLQITSHHAPTLTSSPQALRQALPSVSPSTQEKAVQPNLLPAPILRPTAYSARSITQPQISSSPPYSANSSPDSAVRDHVFRTPALPRSKMYEPAQMSSPPDSEEGDAVRGRMEEDRLTSSAVRGNAAIGLLGLRGAGQ